MRRQSFQIKSKTYQPTYSLRVSLDYRSVGIRDKDVVVWFWIGGHSEHEKFIAHI
jgi:hypothetical protein